MYLQIAVNLIYMFSYINHIYSKLYYICFCMYLSPTSVFDPICVLHLILLGLRVLVVKESY